VNSKASDLQKLAKDTSGKSLRSGFIDRTMPVNKCNKVWDEGDYAYYISRQEVSRIRPALTKTRKLN